MTEHSPSLSPKQRKTNKGAVTIPPVNAHTQEALTKFSGLGIHLRGSAFSAQTSRTDRRVRTRISGEEGKELKQFSEQLTVTGRSA